MTERTSHLRPIPHSDLQTPFVALPDPATLFTRRAGTDSPCRRADRARTTPLCGGLAQAQAALVPHLPNLTPIANDVAERAAAHGMPLIDATRLIDGNGPRGDHRAVPGRNRTDRHARAGGGRACPGCVPRQPHGASILAMHWKTRLRATPLRNTSSSPPRCTPCHTAGRPAPPNMLRPVGTGVCPTCGGAPVACVLVDRPAAHNARYCVCATCATQWNTVRVSCVLCGRTDGIAYYHIEGRDDGISAETCESCRGYVKLLSQVEYPNLDPVVDDVASLALDLKLQDAGWRRGGVNPFLTGY